MISYHIGGQQRQVLALCSRCQCSLVAFHQLLAAGAARQLHKVGLARWRHQTLLLHCHTKSIIRKGGSIVASLSLSALQQHSCPGDAPLVACRRRHCSYYRGNNQVLKGCSWRAAGVQTHVPAADALRENDVAAPAECRARNPGLWDLGNELTTAKETSRD